MATITMALNLNGPNNAHNHPTLIFPLRPRLVLKYNKKISPRHPLDAEIDNIVRAFERMRIVGPDARMEAMLRAHIQRMEGLKQEREEMTGSDLMDVDVDVDVEESDEEGEEMEWENMEWEGVVTVVDMEGMGEEMEWENMEWEALRVEVVDREEMDWEA